MSPHTGSCKTPGVRAAYIRTSKYVLNSLGLVSRILSPKSVVLRIYNVLYKNISMVGLMDGWVGWVVGWLGV